MEHRGLVGHGSGWILVAAALAVATPAGAGVRVRGGLPAPDAICALIVTDDDIPSGSATAGALYVEDAKLGRKLLSADVVAVAEGFLEGGVACVEVVDSHDGAIDPKPLAKIGVPVWTPSNRDDWTWPFLGPMSREYSMAALMGFHSNAGQQGFRPHTINDSIRGLSIDGRVVGEVAHLMVGLAAHGVPVVVVSGDMNATAEARALAAGVRGVTVRWLDEAGETRFLGDEEAHEALREAATAAARESHELVDVGLPVRIRVETHSLERMQDRGPGVAAAFAEYIEGERALLDADPLGADVVGSGLAGGRATVEGRGLSWTEDTLAGAFGSIAFAAWNIRGSGGGSGWAEVGKGYKAFGKGRYEEALEHYEEALRLDPYDTATHCRIGAVHQKLGDLDRAREEYAYGVQRLDEVGDLPMKVWCARGLARVESETGRPEEAKEAAMRLLDLEDFGGSHEWAREFMGGLVSGADGGEEL